MKKPADRILLKSPFLGRRAWGGGGSRFGDRGRGAAGRLRCEWKAGLIMAAMSGGAHANTEVRHASIAIVDFAQFFFRQYDVVVTSISYGLDEHDQSGLLPF